MFYLHRYSISAFNVKTSSLEMSIPIKREGFFTLDMVKLSYA